MTLHRILLLTSDAGFGHRRAAEAVADAFTELHGDSLDVHIVNPLDDPSLPDLVKMLETTYDDMVTEDPTLYQLAYAATDAPVVANLLQRVTTSVLNDTLTEIVQRYRPDAVLATYPAYIQGMVRITAKLRRPVSVSTIVTDLIGVHSLWFNQEATYTFVPTGNVYRQALEQGLNRQRVLLTGLPVNPRISHLKEVDRTELRAELGWDPEAVTALIVGSARTRQTANIARLLDSSGLPVQLVVVTGGDEQTYRELETATWKGNVHVYGMVKNMPEMMRAADLLICKAGGLIVSEALASSLPLVLYEALPGQEVGNVRYVVESGAGAWSPGPIGALTTVYSWLAGDREVLKERRAAAEAAGKPRAAYDIVEHVMRSSA